jgi:protein ImuA
MRPTVVLDQLRARIAQIEGVSDRHPVIPFDVAAVDSHLPGGGIAMGALHEVAGSREIADDAAATVFLAGILARVEGTVFWCLHWRDLFAPALQLAGLDPERIVFVEAGNDTDVMIAVEECLRHRGLGGVVGEIKKMSLTASRRLQLAAEQSGVPAFIFRRSSAINATTEGTAAVTRWRVKAAPSEQLGIPSLGRPRWRLELERVRGGDPRLWMVEGCDGTGRISVIPDIVHEAKQTKDRHAA